MAATSIPGVALLLSNAYEMLVAGVQEAKWMGPGVVEAAATTTVAGNANRGGPVNRVGVR